MEGQRSLLGGAGHNQAMIAVVGEFGGAVIAGYLLVRRQANQAMPLLPIDRFRRPVFAISVTTSVLSFVAQGLALVSLPFYFQDVVGMSAVTTGLLMTPWPATAALMAPLAGRVADRYPAGSPNSDLIPPACLRCANQRKKVASNKARMCGGPQKPGTRENQPGRSILGDV